MDLKKDFNRLLTKFFWARPNSEFGEHLATQASTNVWKKYWKCGWLLPASC